MSRANFSLFFTIYFCRFLFLLCALLVDSSLVPWRLTFWGRGCATENEVDQLEPTNRVLSREMDAQSVRIIFQTVGTLNI